MIMQSGIITERPPSLSEALARCQSENLIDRYLNVSEL